MARKRDRHGRFLKKGHGGTKRRKKARRKNGRRSGGTRKRRSHARRARSSNPPPRRRRRRTHAGPAYGRRRRSHARRSRRSSRRRSNGRRHGRGRSRMRNPPYTIATTLTALGLAAVGFTIAKTGPMLLAKATGRASLNEGWEGVGVSAGLTLLTSLIGYGIGRLASTKRTAAMVAGTLAIGGTLSVAHEAIVVYRKPAAPPKAIQPAAGVQVPTKGTGPLGLITANDLARARSAAGMLGLSGMGNISPSDLAKVSGGGTFSEFPAESKF